MKVLIVIMVALALMFAPVSSIAQKGPSDKAYEHASDKAKFKRDQGSVDKDKSGKKGEEEATEQEQEMSEEEKAEKKAEKEEMKAEKKAEKKEKKSKKKGKKKK